MLKFTLKICIFLNLSLSLFLWGHTQSLLLPWLRAYYYYSRLRSHSWWGSGHMRSQGQNPGQLHGRAFVLCYCSNASPFWVGCMPSSAQWLCLVHSGDHMDCQGVNPGWICERQMSYPRFIATSLPVLFLLLEFFWNISSNFATIVLRMFITTA